MHLTLATAPTTTPISLAEAKAQLRVDFTDDDTMISALIDAATAYFDARNGVLGRALVTQTWDYGCDAFPGVYPYAIELPFPPLASVTSVKYLDGSGVEQTLASTEYTVETAEFVGRARLAYGKTWPETLDEPNAVRVRYVCGYGAAAAVPAPLRQAMLMHVQKHYDTSLEPQQIAAIDNCINALSAPYRLRGV